MKNLFLSVDGNSTFDVILIWSVVAIVFFSCFGLQMFKSLKRLNDKYHIIGWNKYDVPDIYSYDED